LALHQQKTGQAPVIGELFLPGHDLSTLIVLSCLVLSMYPQNCSVSSSVLELGSELNQAC